jgi:GDSL-like lipase/acylhydrolase family protein
MSRVHRGLLLAVLTAGIALFGARSALAANGIVFTSGPGTGPPPTSLGGHPVTPFGPDPTGLFEDVYAVTGPSGDILFESPMQHLQIGNGWATWSNGYTGDVYWTEGADTASIDLPSGTTAFYLYAEPNPFAVYNVTATAEDGSSQSATLPVDGYFGAEFFGFYTTGTEKIARVTISSNVDFSIGEFGINGGGYVALGDSYSSGEGNPPFQAGTNGGGDFCHRSDAAYSEVLGSEIGLSPLFYACSGAVTSDITSTVHYTEPPQITRDGVDQSTQLLTMTIGGNDAGFSGVLKSCIEQKLKADAFNALIGPVAVWLGLGKDPSCAHSSSFTSSVDTQVRNVFWPVKLTELQVLSATDPDKTSIIVADYPRLFPTSSDDQGCTQLSFLFTKDDMNWMNGEGDVLDSVLQEAAGEAGVNFVDVRGAFAGHEVCTGDPYVNGLSIASGSGGACTLTAFGHCIIPGLPIVGSFHPNAEGHASGYAAPMLGLIDSAADQTPAGFPKNPPALPDPPGQPAPTDVGVGDLNATPVTPGAEDCSDTYQAGQQVQYSGAGFAPGAAVQLFATSAVGEVQVGTTTADASGAIAGVVRIPVGATAFTPDSSALAGTVFLDAIGVGSVAAHLDDVAMVGLAPRSSSCGTVETFDFAGFDPPASGAVTQANPGRAIPVKFTLAGTNATLPDVLAADYPQSAPVSCTSPETLTSGTPTTSNATPSTDPSDFYNYVWKTDKSWRGCRELIVKLVDGSYHQAVFDFGG